MIISLRALVSLLALLMLMGGCASLTVNKVNYIEAIQAKQQITENQLLDVGVFIFNPGIPESEKKREKETIIPEVRKAEARYIPFTLKNTLQATSQWGAVRVIPAETSSVDLIVNGDIVESNGEVLAVNIEAKDSAGRTWLKKKYTDDSSSYSYTEGSLDNVDPFQDLYNAIANDLLEARMEYSGEELSSLRQVSKLRFAGELAPQSFADHLEQDKNGVYEIQRLPASDDPTLNRIEKIRQRENLFVDTLDEYYSGFYQDMNGPYRDWRKSSYDETKALNELRASAWKRGLLGAAAIVGGAVLAARGGATGTLGQVAIIGGVAGVASGISKSSESKIHVEALEELGQSFRAEVAPRVVELEGKTVTLTGSVEEQFAEWRELLKEIYSRETGFPIPADSAPKTDS